MADDALQAGLIDGVGYLDQALIKLAELIKVDDDLYVVRYEKKRDVWDAFWSARAAFVFANSLVGVTDYSIYGDRNDESYCMFRDFDSWFVERVPDGGTGTAGGGARRQMERPVCGRAALRLQADLDAVSVEQGIAAGVGSAAYGGSWGDGGVADSSGTSATG